MRPLRVAGFGHGDEIRAVEDGGDTLDIEELGCERGRVWWSERGARGEVFKESGREVLGKDAVVGNEFQGLVEQSDIVSISLNTPKHHHGAGNIHQGWVCFPSE